MRRRHIATTDTTVALTSLQPCRSALLAARPDALTVATRVAGARAARARELVDQISDTLGHLHRLIRVLDDNELDELAYGEGRQAHTAKDDQESGPILGSDTEGSSVDVRVNGGSAYPADVQHLVWRWRRSNRRLREPGRGEKGKLP